MDLMWIVYFVSLLEPIGKFLSLSAILMFGASFFAVIFTIMHTEGDEYRVRWHSDELEDRQNARKIIKTWIKRMLVVGVFTSLIATFLPEQKTAYMMIGAYATQQVYEAPETKQVADKVLKIVNNKLDEYVKETAKQATK